MTKNGNKYGEQLLFKVNCDTGNQAVHYFLNVI